MSSLSWLKNGRYLLFLDILGFSAIVSDRNADEIYALIDKALQAFDRWEKFNHQFRTIYFSDTFIFYQETKGYGDWAFLDVYAIGAMVLSALLANKIPARGSITFGEFEVRNDSTSKHKVYFGEALIEAYKSEKKENWIGIAIQPSAWIPYEESNKGTIKVYESERVWRIREDGVLMLNPFVRIRGWYEYDLIGEIDAPYMEWDRPEFPNDVQGFRFLHDKAKEFAQKGDFSSHEAVKYHSTIAFLQDVLGEDIYRWAEKISQQNM
jgi:hypothetical protein